MSGAGAETSVRYSFPTDNGVPEVPGVGRECSRNRGSRSPQASGSGAGTGSCRQRDYGIARPAGALHPLSLSELGRSAGYYYFYLLMLSERKFPLCANYWCDGVCLADLPVPAQARWGHVCGGSGGDRSHRCSTSEPGPLCQQRCSGTGSARHTNSPSMLLFGILEIINC